MELLYVHLFVSYMTQLPHDLKIVKQEVLVLSNNRECGVIVGLSLSKQHPNI